MGDPKDNIADAATLVADYTSAFGEEAKALHGTLLASRWSEHGVTPDLLALDANGTLGRDYATRAGVLPPDSAATDREAVKAAPAERVVLGDIIGEGAMGVVRQAHQGHLRRTVAVKEPRIDMDAAEPDPQILSALLREAWISGNLEHPNIVPIHLLSREGDKPLIVMKRIEGLSWAEALRRQNSDGGADARPSHERAGVPADHLEEHLGIFTEVCHAVHFAHSRGVLHLDLKPDNVMVGEFGEVYVLDWGIAAGIGNKRPTWMPDAHAIAAVIGTPGYLSPEQAEGDGEMFGTHTDVYLLGAILHEILMGERLHPGSLVSSLISSHRAVPPEYGPEVPAELAQIVRRAVAPLPRDRFASVDAMREAVESFISHRRSNELTVTALSMMEAIRQTHHASSVETAATAAVNHAIDYENQVTECRFALQQALRVWPDNSAAIVGLTELLTLLVERACDDGDLRSAAAALSEHPSPSEPLEKRVAALRTKLKHERAEERELRELGQQHDLSRNRRQRFVLSLVSGFTWFFWNYGMGALDKADIFPISHTALLLSWALSAGTFAIVLLTVGRSSLLATEINRRGVGIIWAGFSGVGVIWVGGAFMGMDPLVSGAMAHPVYFAGAMCLAATVDRRIWVFLPFMLVPLFGAFFQPQDSFEWAAYTGLAGGFILGWLWRTTPQLPEDERKVGGPASFASAGRQR